MTARACAAAVAALALLACATAPQAGEKEPFPGTGAAPAKAGPRAGAEAQPQPEVGPVSSATAPTVSELANPKAYAARFPRSDLCEQAARSTLPISRDRAWEVLRACVDRGGFTLIRRLLDGAWDKELQSKGDAAVLIAKVIAARGGDVYGDLNLLRQKRVPIFGLAPATGHPELYQGRLVLARARVDDMKSEKGKVTVKLAEFALAGSLKDVAGTERYVTRRKGSSEWSSSRDPSSNRARVRSGYESEKAEGWERTQRTENTPQETGLQALARLQSADPFFEPGRQFVILARFDGVREVPGEGEEGEAERIPVLSVIHYVEPSPVIVE